MTGTSGMRSWEELYEQSDKLVAGLDRDGFPRISRTAEQLEAITRQLTSSGAGHRSSKFPRFDDDAMDTEHDLEFPSSVQRRHEENAAARLLSREGFNEEVLAKNVRNVDLKLTFEDVWPLDKSSVDDYLKSVHEMLLLSAVQEAQRHSSRRFDERLLSAMEEDWEAEKKRGVSNFGRGISTPSGQTPPVTPLAMRLAASGPSAKKKSAMYSFTPTKFGGGGGGTPLGIAGGTPIAITEMSQPRAAAYANAVQELNNGLMLSSSQSNQPLQPCALMLEALEKSGGGGAIGGQKGSMRQVWKLLGCVMRALGAPEASQTGRRPETIPECEEALLRMCAGARKYLEEAMVATMQAIIRRSAIQASLGGKPSNIGKVRAFLRVILKERSGPLDFDTESGYGAVDTTWSQIYYCMRAGYIAEALEVAKGASETGVASMGDPAFLSYLSEWSRAGALSENSASSVALECDRIYRSKERNERTAHKLLVHLILCGSRFHADRLGAEFPDLVKREMKFEEFFWFKLSMIGTVGGGGNGTAAENEPQERARASLADFQQYLRKFPDSHYSLNGKEPLQYVTILILSMQFAEVINYLCVNGEGVNAGFDVDAVHIAITLAAQGITTETMSGMNGLPGLHGLKHIVHGVITQYARDLLRTDPTVPSKNIALDYFAAAAMAQQGGGHGPNNNNDDAALREAFIGALLAAPNLANLLEAGRNQRRHGIGGGGGVGGNNSNNGASEGMGSARPRILSDFISNPTSLDSLLVAAAEAYLKQARYEEAADLFARAHRPALALGILNRRIISSLFSGEHMQEYSPMQDVSIIKGSLAIDADLATAKNLAAAVVASSAHGSGGGEGQGDVIALEHIEQIKNFMEAKRASRFSEAARLLQNLSFIPVDLGRVNICAREIVSLDECIRAKVPDILLAASSVLNSAYQAAVSSSRSNFGATLSSQSEQVRRLSDKMAALAAFAGQCRLQLPPHVYSKLAQQANLQSSRR